MEVLISTTGPLVYSPEMVEYIHVTYGTSILEGDNIFGYYEDDWINAGFGLKELTSLVTADYYGHSSGFIVHNSGDLDVYWIDATLLSNRSNADVLDAFDNADAVPAGMEKITVAGSPTIEIRTKASGGEYILETGHYWDETT